jgi:hypothetical protein
LVHGRGEVIEWLTRWAGQDKREGAYIGKQCHLTTPCTMHGVAGGNSKKMSQIWENNFWALLAG